MVGLREVVIQMHMTLDGFADSRDGFVPLNDRRYGAELNRQLRGTAADQVDTLLLGRGTYRQFNAFWPKVYADPSSYPKGIAAAGRFLTETPKVVFSKSLPKAGWQNSTIVRGDIGAEIARLKRRPGKNLLVPGGVAFPRALIQRDLVDEYFLSVVPIVIGSGRDRLFGPVTRPRTLKHIRSHAFRNGVVLHHFRRAR